MGRVGPNPSGTTVVLKKGSGANSSEGRGQLGSSVLSARDAVKQRAPRSTVPDMLALQLPNLPILNWPFWIFSAISIPANGDRRVVESFEPGASAESAV